MVTISSIAEQVQFNISIIYHAIQLLWIHLFLTDCWFNHYQSHVLTSYVRHNYILMMLSWQSEKVGMWTHVNGFHCFSPTVKKYLSLQTMLCAWMTGLWYLQLFVPQFSVIYIQDTLELTKWNHSLDGRAGSLNWMMSFVVLPKIVIRVNTRF